MIDGRAGIPAFVIAMTNGDLAAVELRSRDGSEGETSRPIRKALET